MLPTLSGRIQTRLLLFFLIGLPVTFLWSWYNEARLPVISFPYIMLVSVLLVGLLLDPVYIYLQGFRWDQDWPFAFQLASMIFEFAVVVGIIMYSRHPYIPAVALGTNDALLFVSSHFVSVLIPSFLALLGPLQVFLVRWRYKSGELGRM
jgi:hypothetical protein